MSGKCLIRLNRCLLAGCLILAGWVSYSATAVAMPSSVAVSNSAACPFCSAIALTFTEQLNANEVAVVAKLVEPPPPPKSDDEDFPKGTFEIVGVLKGQKIVKEGMTFKTQLVGSYPEGQKFLVMGVSPPNIAWTTPMRASDRVFKYLQDIQKLPEKGPERLVFFQDYFEDEEPVLAFDAYDEFAKAPYEDLKGMKDQIQHDKLIGWIKDTENTTVNRRRLYLTMLGVCGTKKDAQMLEEFIKSGDRKKQAGLDALVACYLTLKGADGVKLIEEQFLKGTDVDYVDTLAAVSALRFHATETDIVPRDRIVAAVRMLLDRPEMADMIIPDLARWEDWSVMERLVKMFKEADEDSNWLRVPVITYLRACPKPEAAKYIEELRKIDPQAVQRADFFIGFGDDDEEGDDWDDDDEDSTTEQKPAEKTESDTQEKADKGGDQLANKGGTPLSVSERKDSPTLQQAGLSAVPDHPIQVASGHQPPVQGPMPDGQSDLTASPSADSESSVALTIEPGQTTYVSAPASPADQRQPKENFSLIAEPTVSPAEKRQVAQTPSPALVAAASSGAGMTWRILLIPFGGSLLLFALMWSVVNGWFERLIF